VPGESVARMSEATSGDHSNTAPDIASLIRATSEKMDCFAALAMMGWTAPDGIYVPDW
jgi:hypothetical protein